MDTGAALVGLVMLLTLPPSGVIQTEQEPIKDPGAEFRRAFTEEMNPAERTHALERVAKEHPGSRWADDALWVLGEVARQQGMTRRTMYFWHYLMARRADVELEEFTRTQEVYRSSRLAQVRVLLESDGIAYVADGSRIRKEPTAFFVNARPVNPVPMVVWEELARSYQGLKKPELALKAYGKALESAPERGRWARIYRQRIESLEKRLRPPDQAGSPDSKTAGSTPASLQTPQQPANHEPESVTERTQTQRD